MRNLPRFLFALFIFFGTTSLNATPAVCGDYANFEPEVLAGWLAKVNNSNDSVDACLIQLGLARLGYGTEQEADGQFGKTSQTNLKSFQRDQGLNTDGRWGAKSRATLVEKLKVTKQDVKKELVSNKTIINRLLTGNAEGQRTANLSHKGNTYFAKGGTNIGKCFRLFQRLDKAILLGQPFYAEDKDVRRMRDEISKREICYGRIKMSDGGRNWHLTLLLDPNHEGPLWYLPYDSDDAAFDSAVYALQNYGGLLITPENKDNRNIDGQDPRFIFARTEAEATACKAAKKPYPKILSFIGKASDFHAEGLPFFVLREQKDESQDFIAPADWQLALPALGSMQDSDNLVYAAYPSALMDDPKRPTLVHEINQAPANVLYEDQSLSPMLCQIHDWAMDQRAQTSYAVLFQQGQTGDAKTLIDVLLSALIKIRN